MNLQTALQAMKTGQTVKVTDEFGHVYTGTIDGQWQMAKTRFGWDRWMVGMAPEGAQLGSILYTVRFKITGPNVPAGLTSSVDATLDEMEIV